MYLPRKEEIPGTSIAHSELANDKKAWEHPVVVRSVNGSMLEICLCSSFSSGQTHESERPAWYHKSAMVIWDGVGQVPAFPASGPTTPLAMSTGCR